MAIRILNNEKFLVDLVLQRTNYLVSSGYGHLVAEWTKTGSTNGIKQLLLDHKWKSEFLNQCIKSSQEDASLIISSLSDLPKNPVIASIGPGNCFVELLISRQLNPSQLILIDIEDTKNHHHGYHSEGAGYCSLDKSYEFLKTNLIEYCQSKNLKCPSILLCNPKTDFLPQLGFDLCISLLSAGFHYPIGEYTQYFSKNWKVNGKLIFDARNPSQSCSEINNLPFSVISHEPLIKTNKLSRVVFQRP